MEKSLSNAKNNNLLIKLIFLFISGLLFWIIYRSYQRHKHYKILYFQFKDNENKQNLVNLPLPVSNTQLSISKPIIESYDLLDINPILVKDILGFLSTFEAKKGFLDKDITLTKMAAEFGTNISYLSKVINFYKQENFLSYITTLRLNYTIELWQKEPLTRHYRINEISSIVGFKTVQSFAKNFREKHKISPKYFLKNINESNIR